MLGALVFRGIFIAIGAAALGAAHWVIYVFGAFLVFTAYRLARARASMSTRSRNRLLPLIRRFVPSTDDYRGTRVFVREHGRRLATPIFAVLIVVASTDVVFAIDSIPAIFAITDEAFIVLAANIFAVMGLRAAYFLIVGVLDPLRVPALRARRGPRGRRPEDADQRGLRPAGLDDARGRRRSSALPCWYRSGPRGTASAEPEQPEAAPGGADAVAVTGGGSYRTG